MIDLVLRFLLVTVSLVLQLALALGILLGRLLALLVPRLIAAWRRAWPARAVSGGPAAQRVLSVLPRADAANARPIFRPRPAFRPRRRNEGTRRHGRR
jgi:hypothetical protein